MLAPNLARGGEAATQPPPAHQDNRRVPRESSVLVERISANEERPWAGQLNPRRLARLLRPFGIRPRSLWAEYGGQRSSVKGYFRDDCNEAFSRYLGDSTPDVAT